jgi:hypothetical protein
MTGARAWIDGIDGRLIRTQAEIVRPDGGRSVTTHAVFAALDLEQATDAAGGEIAGEAAGYVT